MPTVTQTRALLVLYVGTKFAEPNRLLKILHGHDYTLPLGNS